MPKTCRRCLVCAVTIIAGVSASSAWQRAARADTLSSVGFAVIGDSGTGETPQYSQPSPVRVGSRITILRS